MTSITIHPAAIVDRGASAQPTLLANAAAAMDVDLTASNNGTCHPPKDRVSSLARKHRPTTRTKEGTVIFHFVATSAEAG